MPGIWLTRFIAFDRFADTIRVLVALSAVMGYTALTGHNDQLIPLMLGVIASGIAETDDSWRRRARALMLTLTCFSVAALLVALADRHQRRAAALLALELGDRGGQGPARRQLAGLDAGPLHLGRRAGLVFSEGLKTLLPNGGYTLILIREYLYHG